MARFPCDRVTYSPTAQKYSWPKDHSAHTNLPLQQFGYRITPAFCSRTHDQSPVRHIKIQLAAHPDVQCFKHFIRNDDESCAAEFAHGYVGHGMLLVKVGYANFKTCTPVLECGMMPHPQQVCFLPEVKAIAIKLARTGQQSRWRTRMPESYGRCWPMCAFNHQQTLPLGANWMMGSS